MKDFDIGFIPMSWKRGEKLRIWPATPTRRGRIEQDALCSFDEFMKCDPMKAIAAIGFQYGDKERVENWLTWWREGNEH